MSGSYYPSKDTEFLLWLGNFVYVALNNETELGLTTAEIDPVKVLQGVFNNNLTEVEAKKADLAAAVEKKDATKNNIIQDIRVLVNKIQANPNVTPALKALLGISTRDGGQNPVHPIPVTDLAAKLTPDGSIELSWNRNGNSPAAQFMIEYLDDTVNEWKLLDIVTKTTYIHKGHPLGKPIKYVIKTRRVDDISAPSNPASVQ